MIPTLLALYLGGPLLILFVGGLLVHARIYREVAASRGASYPRSRLLGDLRPIRTTMMDFIAESPYCREFMQHLANNRAPIPLRSLVRSTPAVEANWTALFIMSVAGLLRFGSRGVGLTSVGDKVLRGIDGAGASHFTARAEGGLLRPGSDAEPGASGAVGFAGVAVAW